MNVPIASHLAPAARTAALATAVALFAQNVALAAEPSPAPAPLSTVTHATAGEAGEGNDRRSDRKALLKIEDATEAIAEGETTGTAAQTAAREAAASWPSVRATLQQSGASSDALAKVDGAMATLRKSTAANLERNANEVTGALAPLFTTVGERVPAAVHSLDYLGRSVGLDVREGTWARADSDVAMLKERWLAVRAQVETRTGGVAAATRFDAAVGAIVVASKARDAKRTLDATKQTTDAVDVLEKVF